MDLHVPFYIPIAILKNKTHNNDFDKIETALVTQTYLTYHFPMKSERSVDICCCILNNQKKDKVITLDTHVHVVTYKGLLHCQLLILLQKAVP